jgi:hypothetical protein
MSYVTADDATVARLKDVREPIEIRDGAGNVLGRFTPTLSLDQATRQDQVGVLFDLEEARRVFAAERHLGRPLSDIWRDLYSKENAKW